MEGSIALVAEAAVRNYYKFRYRFKRSTAHDAVYVISYSQCSTHPGKWTYDGNFTVMDTKKFECFRLQNALAEFIEVAVTEPLLISE